MRSFPTLLIVSILLGIALEGNATPPVPSFSPRPEQAQIAETTPGEKAEEAVQKGRESLARNTRDAMEQAVEFFNQAVAHDPSYAPAHVGLADSYTLLWSFGFLSREEALPKARAAAERAVRLDESLAEAHSALAVVRLRDWDWAGAEEGFKAALKLNPTDANSHHWYALYLSAMGRHEEAIRHSKRAVALDPSPSMQVGLGSMYYFAREWEEMITQMQKTLDQDPDFAYAYDWIGMAYVQVRDFERAFTAYHKAVSLSGHSAEVLAGLGHAYGVAGEKDKARKILRELTQLSEQRYVPSVQVAFVYTSLGEKERALARLEQAYQERAWELVFVKVEPWLDPLRSEPRFQELLRRLNFPD